MIIDATLKLAAFFVRYFMPPRSVPKYRTSLQPVTLSCNTLLYPCFNPFNKTYDEGYKIAELGPESLCPMKVKMSQ